MRTTLIATFNPFLLPYVIGRRGAGTKKVLSSVKHGAYVFCVVEVVNGELEGVARLTADVSEINDLVSAFYKHVSELTKLFRVTIHYAIAESMLIKNEAIVQIRKECCMDRFCSITYVRDLGNPWGCLKCECLAEDEEALKKALEAYVNKLHATYPTKLPHSVKSVMVIKDPETHWDVIRH